MAQMAVADILAIALVQTQLIFGYALSQCCVVARNHFHVTQHASPARRTNAFVQISMLLASGVVQTGISIQSRTPIDVLVASSPGETVRTITGVESHTINARPAVCARIRVAFIDRELTIRSGESRCAIAREIVYPVDAFATVHTSSVRTIFIIHLAIGSGKS
jgi:hypothetical protein